jgi:uncharacterized protein (DUF433 family)
MNAIPSSTSANQLPPAGSHIAVTPGVCGGKPRISGTRIRVQDIVIWYERLGTTADEIVTEYPQLSLADVHAALAYYHDHRTTVDEQMEHGAALAEELKLLYPSKLRAKFVSPND